MSHSQRSAFGRFRGLIVALVMLFSLSAARAQTAQLKVYGQLRYINGVNMAWMHNPYVWNPSYGQSFGSDYGHDLGYNAFSGVACRYSSSDVATYFADMRKMHCNVVRVWLFEGLEGLTFDASGLVSGVDVGFQNNLKDLLNVAASKGIAVELTLLNHDLNAQFGGRATNGATVRNFVTDATAQQAFLNNAVNTLYYNCVTTVNSSGQRQLRPEFFGFDVLNEANYAVNPYNGRAPVCTWSQLHSFLYNVAGRIHQLQPSIQVGCGTDNADDFSSANHWNRLGGIGLDYYGYHNYSDAPNIFWRSDSSKAIDKPLLLEEYNGRTQNNETTQTAAVDAYLNQAAARGYAGALAWNYNNYFDNVASNNALSINNGPDSWKGAAWKVSWWGANFGL